MSDSLPLPSPTLEVNSDLIAEKCDVLVAGLFSGGPLSPTLQKLDDEIDGGISRLVEADHIRGKGGESTLVSLPNGPVATLMVMGLGDGDFDSGGESCERQLAFETASAAIRKLMDRPRSKVALSLAESFSESAHDAVVSGAIFGCEGQGIYQEEPALRVPDVLAFSGVHAQAVTRGKVLGDCINQTRRLVNEPASAIYPESFAARATELANACDLEIETWDEKKLDREGCRAILAVGQGSSRPPRLVILRHRGGGEEPPIALVGKGVTFDSGGLSLKPSDGMVAMKCDMAGAATVLGVMLALKQLGIKRNVIGFCGLAENMVSGNSYKLGDVIETRSGKTIEIMNTDAEGRVVLADTLDVALQHQPSAMIDLATLTGAALVALGTDVAALMTNNQSLCDEVMVAAKTEGEAVWQLPMFSRYNEQIKSKVADIKNTGEGRYGGAITAAKFLENFVGDTPWLHMDIAGPAFSSLPKPYRDAGATGVMIRTLLRWIETTETSNS